MLTDEDRQVVRDVRSNLIFCFNPKVTEEQLRAEIRLAVEMLSNILEKESE